MMHRLFISGGKLIVEFEGLEGLEAIKRRLEFSVSDIVSVTTGPHPWIEGVRIGGTGLPGVIKEGRYVIDNRKVFFAMRHADKCVTVEFRNEDYDGIVIEVDDKEKVAEEIRNAAKTS